jgi:hypothetical protein
MERKKKRKERGDFINERLAKGKERIKWINMYEDKLMEEAKRKKKSPKQDITTTATNT